MGNSPLRVDVAPAGDGREVFGIDRLWNVRLFVSDADARDRHLVLVADHPGHTSRFSRFLCGHDEKAWFVAAVPETHEVRSVGEAKDALKPEEVWDEIRAHDLPRDQWNLRWTSAFVRQGEWFFLPRPGMQVNYAEILRNEPISRGSGQPHWCEAVFRIGGEPVYVHALFPNGLTWAEFARLDRSQRTRTGWTQRVRDARVFAKGLVRHRDHATIRLPCWHEVVMNTETRARAMENVAFLD
jgi:hypothetical protein